MFDEYLISVFESDFPIPRCSYPGQRHGSKSPGKGKEIWIYEHDEDEVCICVATGMDDQPRGKGKIQCGHATWPKCEMEVRYNNLITSKATPYFKETRYIRDGDNLAIDEVYNEICPLGWIHGGDKCNKNYMQKFE